VGVVLVYKADFSHLYVNGPLPDCLRWVSLSYHRVQGYWSVHLKELKIGDEDVLRSEAIAILDTGASMIFGPYDDVGYLADALGGWCAEFTSSRSSSVVQVRVTKYMELICTCILYNVLLYFVVNFIPVFVWVV